MKLITALHVYSHSRYLRSGTSYFNSRHKPDDKFHETALIHRCLNVHHINNDVIISFIHWE